MGGNSLHTSHVNERISENSVQSHYKRYGILFQYPCFQASKFDCSVIHRLVSVLPLGLVVGEGTPSHAECSKLVRLLNSFHVFPSVYAADTPSNTVNGSATNVNERQTEKQTHPYEALARLLIEKETGRERVRAIFKKNHKGDSSTPMYVIQFSLVQIFAISFFIKYVPSWKLAKEDFIREHNATSFRTPIDAVRRMNDIASFKAIIDGLYFATKITTFSAGFLFFSQMLASYRNRTSVFDYTIAAGITGGLARLQMGPKGFVAGSVVGLVLGTIFGCVTSATLHFSNLTEDVRHLQDVISRLEVERSIVGDQVFEENSQKLMSGLEPTPSLS